MIQGEVFKKYIESQRLNKSQLAKNLGMSRQNLYQLFESATLEDETIQKIEKALGISMEEMKREKGVNIDNQKTVSIKNSAGPNELTEQNKNDETWYKASISDLSESTKKLSDSNLINAKNIERLITILEMKLGITIIPSEFGQKAPPDHPAWDRKAGNTTREDLRKERQKGKE